MNIVRFLLPALLIVYAGAARADVIITEVMQNPAAVSDSYGEWFEVHNGGGVAVVLDGWTISTNAGAPHTIGTLTIPAGEYYVLGLSGNMALNGGVAVDYIYSGFFLGNGADSIVLRNTSNVVMDEIHYDGGIHWPDPNGASMYLLDLGTDNNVGENWGTSTTMWEGSAGDFGTPGLANNDIPLFNTELENWSFEDWTGGLPDEWSAPSPDLAISQLTGTAIHGISAVSATLTSDQGFHYLSQTLLATLPGQLYQAELSVFDNDPAGKVRIQIIAFNLNGEVMGSVSSEGSINTPSEFQTLTVDFTVPQNAYQISMAIQFYAFDQFWDGDATMFVDAAVFAPRLSVAELQTDESWQGMRIWMQGIVTQATNTVHSGYVDAYLQDDSGYGVMIYDPDPAAADLERGDVISIFARAGQYFDVTELTDFFIKPLAFNHELPAAELFQTGQFNAAVAWEGVWTELMGELTSAPGAPGTSYNITVNDGTGDAAVRIWADAGFDLGGLEIGDNLRILGTMDAYLGESQLQPSQVGDVFPSQPLVDLNLTPVNAIIPPGGGNITFDVELHSHNQFPLNVTAWRAALGPDHVMYGPFYVTDFTLPPDWNPTLGTRTQPVPAGAPAGDYVFFQHLGDYITNSYVWDQFVVTKQGAAASGSGPLTTSDWEAASVVELTGDAFSVVTIPDEFAVGQAYPNPFNPATALVVNLPETGELAVRVYNIAGRLVLPVADGEYPAGRHWLTIDGSSLASGIYFVRVAAAGHPQQVRKIVLMK